MTSAMLVASLSLMRHVNDDFCQWLIDSNEDHYRMYAFSEISEGLKDGVYDSETVSISLQKNEKYRLQILS